MGCRSLSAATNRSHSSSVRPSITHSSGPSEEKARLADWAGRGLTTSALPVRLRGPWNNFLKHNVVNRLREWYAAHEIPAPLDLLVSPTSPNEEALRSLVHRWVDKLEFVELLSLPIPMSAVWRDGGRNF